jgi:hypothetical protein
MLFLAGSTHKFQLTTGQAADIDVYASYSDNAAGTITHGAQSTAIVTATTTDIVAAPSSTNTRKVKFLSIFNKDSADACEVTFILDVSGTDYVIKRVTLLAGEMLQFIETLGWYHFQNSASDLLYKVLDADATGTNVNTAQPWFPTSGAVSVEAGARYWIEGQLRLSRSAGTTSHTTGLLWAGTATLTYITYRAIVNTGDVVTNIAANQTAIEVATNTVVKAASTSASEQIAVNIHGMVQINAAGTLIPQFQYSSAPGGAPTVIKGTFLLLTKLAAGATRGTWA